MLADPGLRLVYELGGICDKVRYIAHIGEYILRTSAHMDNELARCALDSSVNEVCRSFVYVSGFASADDDSKSDYLANQSKEKQRKELSLGFQNQINETVTHYR